MGVKVAEQVPGTEVLYYVKAMVETFIAYGNYENRGKARTRYMQETLGADGYKMAYLEKLEAVKTGEDLKLEVIEQPVNKRGTARKLPADV